MSIMHPFGVQGTIARRPAVRRPAFTTWKPSTSFSGGTASSTADSRICCGSGSCTRMPWDAVVLGQAADLVQEARLGNIPRQAALDGAYAGLLRAPHLVRDIDPACRIISGQDHRQTRRLPAGAGEGCDSVPHIRDDSIRESLAVDDVRRHTPLLH